MVVESDPWTSELGPDVFKGQWLDSLGNKAHGEEWAGILNKTNHSLGPGRFGSFGFFSISHLTSLQIVCTIYVYINSYYIKTVEGSQLVCSF